MTGEAADGPVRRSPVPQVRAVIFGGGKRRVAQTTKKLLCGCPTQPSY